MAIYRRLQSASQGLMCSFGAVLTGLESPRVAWRAVAVLLVIHTGLLGYSAYVHSPTKNEPGHLVAGLSHWNSGGSISIASTLLWFGQSQRSLSCSRDTRKTGVRFMKAQGPVPSITWGMTLSRPMARDRTFWLQLLGGHAFRLAGSAR